MPIQSDRCKRRSSSRTKKIWTKHGLPASFLLAILCLLLGCSTLGFYSQGLRGGLEILRKREPIENLLSNPDLPADLRRKLSTALEIRQFATTELGLPDNGSYRHFTALDRPFAVWNVVAVPELEMEPVRWCFPIAGCVSYRGYFSQRKAEGFASSYRQRGLDVSVSGVTTYSTLGWFKDPVLSTFVHLSSAQLAGVIFHELAHQQLYVKGDTTFNESFATVVEAEGIRRWLDSRGKGAEVADFEARRKRHREIIQLVLSFQGKLKTVYSKDANIAWKRIEKARLIEDFHTAYENLKLNWQGYSGYDSWIDSGVDNAFFASVGSYHDWEPAFEELLRREKGTFPGFFVAAARLSSLPKATRMERLEELSRGRSTSPPPRTQPRAENQ